MNDLLRHTSLLGLRPILCTLAFAVAALCSASSARAPLGVMMEPVINQVPYDENDINLWPVSWFLAEPGEVYTYGVGYPSDPVHNIYNIANDTDHTMTGLALRIVGTAVETGNDDPEYIFDRGAPTEAIFGDVTGDQQVISDIFQKITISKDRKFILLTDGEIPHFPVEADPGPKRTGERERGKLFCGGLFFFDGRQVFPRRCEWGWSPEPCRFRAGATVVQRRTRSDTESDRRWGFQ